MAITKGIESTEEHNVDAVAFSFRFRVAERLNKVKSRLILPKDERANPISLDVVLQFAFKLEPPFKQRQAVIAKVHVFAVNKESRGSKTYEHTRRELERSHQIFESRNSIRPLWTVVTVAIR